MNPLTNTVKTVADTLVIGRSGETALDRFFRFQLLLTMDRAESVEPIDSRIFVSALRPIHRNSMFATAHIKANTPIIPAFRDAFGGVAPQATAAMSKDLELNSRNVWKPDDIRYEDFLFIVYVMYPNSRGWKHGFFVRAGDVIFTQDA